MTKDLYISPEALKEIQFCVEGITEENKKAILGDMYSEANLDIEIENMINEGGYIDESP